MPLKVLRFRDAHVVVLPHAAAIGAAGGPDSACCRCEPPHSSAQSHHEHHHHHNCHCHHHPPHLFTHLLPHIPQAQSLASSSSPTRTHLRFIFLVECIQCFLSSASSSLPLTSPSSVAQLAVASSRIRSAVRHHACAQGRGRKVKAGGRRPLAERAIRGPYICIVSQGRSRGISCRRGGSVCDGGVRAAQPPLVHEVLTCCRVSQFSCELRWFVVLLYHARCWCCFSCSFRRICRGSGCDSMMRVQWIHIRAKGTGRRVQLSVAIMSGELKRDWNIPTGMRPAANKATSHVSRTLLLQRASGICFIVSSSS